MISDPSDQQITSTDLAGRIGEIALSKKAERILILNVRKLTTLTDFFIICSADTEIQVKAICDAIRQGTPHKPWHMEGAERQLWILMDYVDVVVHIFKTSERNYYNLEKLWADAPTREIDDAAGETVSDTSAN